LDVAIKAGLRGFDITPICEIPLEIQTPNPSIYPKGITPEWMYEKF